MFYYVDSLNYIRALHNPDASFSAQDPPRWQEINVPKDCLLSGRSNAAFVTLNSTEIAILGGMDRAYKKLGGVFTFNTITSEFKREVEEGSYLFSCAGN